MKTVSKGFSAVEVLFALIVLAIGGGLGYVYFTHLNDAQPSNAGQSQPSVTVSTIKSTADIDNATKELDSLDVQDSSDSGTLSSASDQL